MASTSELFEQYEADYCQKSTDLAKKLQVLASLPPGKPLIDHSNFFPRPCISFASLSFSTLTHPLLRTHTGQRRSQAKYLEQTINEAEQVLQRLDMEARSSSPTQSRQQIQKVKDYRSDLSKLRTDIRKAASSASSVAGTSTSDASARAELGLGNDFYQTSAGQRDRLLTATDRLNQTSDRLQQGRAQLLETEVGYIHGFFYFILDFLLL